MSLITLWKSMSLGRPLRPAEFNGNMSAIERAVNGLEAQILLKAHPVGSYYWSDEPDEPSTLFGGTWAQVKDIFILAAGDTYTAGATGGESTHTLIVSEIPSHTHDVAQKYKDGSDAHNHGSTNGKLAQAGNTVGWTDTAPSPGAALATGGGLAHNNLPPYKVAYCWTRTE